jgi:hydrogenase maturation protein HypF
VRERLRLEVRGAVQGVGFRPFVYRLAHQLSLDGWVINDNRGVVIEVEGEAADLERFRHRLRGEKPAPATIQELESRRVAPQGQRGFRIRDSRAGDDKTAQLLPDIAICSSCRRELLDPQDRRYGYAFGNCTQCGPRFSIILSLPYDRSGTTMERFSMCEACRAEYREPLDRRFHAQPNACPQCGPTLALWARDGRVTETGRAALERLIEALRRGEIAAVKGLGGFHLMVDARNPEAIGRLRRAKPRHHKPFAVMVRDLEQAAAVCRLEQESRAALASPEAPILLLPRRRTPLVHDSVAPDNPCLGIVLPYTPLHQLILNGFGAPLVATSGNLSDEPICTEEHEAIRRLEGIADRFLVHDRPIARHLDDSVAWIVSGQTRLLRRARGYAPRPVLLDFETPVILAVGAHLKSTVALSVGRQVFISQHIGDMETPQAFEAFERVIADFLRLYEARPAIVAHDLHPDYVSTRWACDLAGKPRSHDGSPTPADRGDRAAGPLRVAVQHHHAHLAACLAENSFHGPALGVTWDGTGYGSDGNIWGGEFLLGDAAGFRRVAHLRSFRLPGGETAIREPRRAALGLLFEIDGAAALERDDLDPVRSFTAPERSLLATARERGVNAPVTTSAGRLFDAVAALIGPWQRTSFEGQAAMGLEFLVDRSVRDAYPLDLLAAPDQQPSPSPGEDRGSAGSGDTEDTSALVLDWRPLVEAVLADLARGTDASVIAARFHNALTAGIDGVARQLGQPAVALSGGCFQNRLLLERSLSRLEASGFRVLLHRQVPPGDGGISLGQVAVAAARWRNALCFRGVAVAAPKAQNVVRESWVSRDRIMR